jgi:hypothetical protein
MSENGASNRARSQNLASIRDPTHEHLKQFSDRVDRHDRSPKGVREITSINSSNCRPEISDTPTARHTRGANVDEEVVIRRFDAPYQAEMAAAFLKSNGIQARVDNDVVQGMNPLWSSALGGVKLHVPKTELEEAQELLFSIEQKPEPTKKDDPDRVVGRATVAAVLGITMFPLIGSLYSLWLLTVHVRTAELSARGRRDRRFALFLDLLVVGLVAYMIFS